MLLHQRARGSHHKQLNDTPDVEGSPQQDSTMVGAFHYSELEGGRKRWMWPWEAVRRRSCRGFILSCGTIIAAAFAFMFVYTWTYKWLNSRDACVVAVETDHKIRSFPRQSAVHGYKPVLPKIIHQQWKTDEVPEGPMTRYRNSFKRLFPEPEYKYMLWTDKSARDLIKNEFPFFLKTYDSYRFNIQRADATRYFVLYKYGGLYADLDYEPLTNFWEHLPTDRVAFVESPYQFNEYTQNSLMSSPVRDPFWNNSFSVLMERAHLPVLHSTGPSFVDAAIRSSNEPHHRLPCENFQRYVYWENAEDDNSPFFSKFGRDFQRHFMPIKHCGDYHDMSCQYARHHNSVSYFGDTGIIGMAFGG